MANIYQYTSQISVEDYNLLRKAVGWRTCNPDRVSKALEHSDYLIAAQYNDRIIGMARVMQDGLQALIMDVIVLPEFQGQHIGKTMMQNVMNYLNSVSEDGGLFVNLASAIGKEGFYEQFGFQRRPNDHQGSGMTQWIG